MRDKFFELSEEKQKRIINAAMQVFGSNEYKRAVTDDIAAKAGISKGLLFYYFENKKSLYLYLFQYCATLMKSMVIDDSFYDIDDFFELIAHGAKTKSAVLREYPYIMEFVMRAYYSQNEGVSDDVQKGVQVELQQSFQTYFKHVNFNKFKDGVDPSYVYRMLVWMSDGFLHEVQSRREVLDVDMIMNEFYKWSEMFKKMVYKEEYQ